MKKVALTLVLVFSFGSVFSNETQLHVLFPSGSSEINVTAKQQLDSLMKHLEAIYDFELFVDGHTDNVGTIGYNKGLAQDRANAIGQYLSQGSISSELISLNSHGEEMPAFSNRQESERRLNRRVVIRIKKYDFQSIEELEDALKEDGRNEFIVNTKKEHVLKGKNGCKVYLPAKSFRTAAGKVYEGEVKVEVTEALNFQDFVASGLMTVSGNRFLESGGMVNISVETEDGEQLDLDPTQNLTVSIPRKSRKRGRGMQLFVSDSGSNWDATGQDIKNPYDGIMMPPYPQVFIKSKKLPEFKRDLSSKPRHPTKRRRPIKPGTPDQTSFEPEITWYNFYKAGRLRRDGNKRYQSAMERYEKRLARYEYLKGLYDHTELNYDGNVMDYKEALCIWNNRQVQDSLDLIHSDEYQSIIAENKLLREKSLEAHEKNVAEWYALRRELIGEIADRLDKMGLQSDKVMNQYVTSMTALKWINIDRFWDMSEQNMFQITVYDKTKDESTKAMIMFNDISSMLPLKRKNKNVLTQRLPKNSDAYLFSYKVENGKTWVCLKPLNNRTYHNLEYKPYKFKELKELLSQVG